MFRHHLHPWYRKDQWIIALDKATDFCSEKMRSDLEGLAGQSFSDTATWSLPMYERELKLTGSGGRLEDRRAAVEAGWKRGGKVGIAEIQAAANSWRNGAVEVDFQDGTIILKFVSEYGIPKDLNGFKNAIDIIKPAHLSIDYIFKFLLIKEIHNIKTIAQMETITLDKFAFGG